jgi:DNA-binding MarR family transcriptional regulator
VLIVGNTAARKSHRPTLLREAITAYSEYWQALRRTAEPAWSQLELTLSQLKAILVLDTRGPMTISQVGAILVISRPAASILIDQLVQLGLVDRTTDQADRRRAIVVLTTKGVDLAHRLTRGDREFMRAWFACMNDEDLAALSRGMRALAAAITPTSLDSDAEDGDPLSCAN